MIKNMFPNVDVVAEYSHPDFKLFRTQQMEFDIFVPSLSLAFEYNGQHHCILIIIMTSLAYWKRLSFFYIQSRWNTGEPRQTQANRR
jgi:hypothetical protein